MSDYICPYCMLGFDTAGEYVGHLVEESTGKALDKALASVQRVAPQEAHDKAGKL